MLKNDFIATTDMGKYYCSIATSLYAVKLHGMQISRGAVHGCILKDLFNGVILRAAAPQTVLKERI